MGWWCKECKIAIPSNPSAPCPGCNESLYLKMEKGKVPKDRDQEEDDHRNRVDEEES